MCRCFSEFFFLALCTSQASKCPLLFSWSVIVLSLKLEQPVIKDVYALILLKNWKQLDLKFRWLNRRFYNWTGITVCSYQPQGKNNNPLYLYWGANNKS
jgi:hypothetical protein